MEMGLGCRGNTEEALYTLQDGEITANRPLTVAGPKMGEMIRCTGKLNPGGHEEVSQRRTLPQRERGKHTAFGCREQLGHGGGAGGAGRRQEDQLEATAMVQARNKGHELIQ